VRTILRAQPSKYNLLEKDADTFEMPSGGKHASLFQETVNSGGKKFYNAFLGGIIRMLF